MKIYNISPPPITQDIAQKCPTLAPALVNMTRAEYDEIITKHVKQGENFTFVGTVEGKLMRTVGRI